MFAILLGVFVFAATGTPPAAPSAVPPAMASNVYVVDPANPLSAEICASRGGTVSVAPDGKPICTLPKGCKPWAGAQLMHTTMLNPATDQTRKACTDACGQLSSNPAGQTFCSKAQEAAGVRSWKPREPTH